MANSMAEAVLEAGDNRHWDEVVETATSYNCHFV
jgi:hypothetical protein